VLVQDHRARRALALNLEAGPLKVLALGPAPPPPDALGTVLAARRDRHLPALHPPFFYCGHATGTMGALVEELARELQVQDREAYVRNFERDHGDQREMMMGLALALRRVDREGPVWSSLGRRLAEQRPEDAGAALLVAEHAAATGDWQEVVQHLETADPGKLDDNRERHCHHLLGIALLHLGRPEEAAAAFRAAPPLEHGCALAPLIALAQAMAESPAVEEWGPDQPLARQVVGAIQTADRALAAGDLEAARKALVRRAIWKACELQSAARLAELYLRTPDEGLAAAERFRKRLALAFFCHLRKGKELFVRQDLDLPGLAWERARIEELAGRAQSWLDGD
jgi:tetratricopeptide (TPR) repeat protein